MTLHPLCSSLNIITQSLQQVLWCTYYWFVWVLLKRLMSAMLSLNWHLTSDIYIEKDNDNHIHQKGQAIISTKKKEHFFKLHCSVINHIHPSIHLYIKKKNTEGIWGKKILEGNSIALIPIAWNNFWDRSGITNTACNQSQSLTPRMVIDCEMLHKEVNLKRHF